MAILPVKSPCTTTNISRGAPIVLLDVAGHSGYCQIFGIWNNSLLSNPLWNLICRILLWDPTRSISFWPAVFLDMALFATLVEIRIWPDRWLSSRATNIPTAVALESNMLQILVDLLLKDHSVCLQKWRLFLILLFDGSRFPPLWILNIVVLSRSLLYKGLIGYEFLFWYEIHVTHTKFLDKIHNLLVLLNSSNTEYGFRSILKDVINVS